MTLCSHCELGLPLAKRLLMSAIVDAWVGRGGGGIGGGGDGSGGGGGGSEGGEGKGRGGGGDDRSGGNGRGGSGSGGGAGIGEGGDGCVGVGSDSFAVGGSVECNGVGIGLRNAGAEFLAANIGACDSDRSAGERDGGFVMGGKRAATIAACACCSTTKLYNGRATTSKQATSRSKPRAQLSAAFVAHIPRCWSSTGSHPLDLRPFARRTSPFARLLRLLVRLLFALVPERTASGHDDTCSLPYRASKMASSSALSLTLLWAPAGIYCIYMMPPIYNARCDGPHDQPPRTGRSRQAS